MHRYDRRNHAIASALVLLATAGCGGGNSSPSPVAVTGTVSGLVGTGLVLTDNGSDRMAVQGDGAFAFASRLAPGSAYSVRVLTQPTDPNQVCRISGGDGRAGGTDVTSIVVICATSALKLLAGNMGGQGTVDGVAAVARFINPMGIATDAAGNIYIADAGSRTIRKLTPAGEVSTFAGTAGAAGNADGIGAAAQFANPAGLAADAAGNLYVADADNNSIRKITPEGLVTTLAGSGSAGSADGIGTAAQFHNPQAVAVDSAGTVYVADTGTPGHPAPLAYDIWVPATNGTIRKIAPDGTVTTLAGTAGVWGTADGVGAAATFNGPAGIAVDPAGNLYIADTGNATIRTITPAGAVQTLAGTARAVGNADGIGATAQFASPRGLALDVAGTLYVADTANNAIRAITSRRSVTTLAVGLGAYGPSAVAADAVGELYVTGWFDGAIRRITSTGVASTFAGSVPIAGNADGLGAAAEFSNPGGVAADTRGNVYVADSANHTIRRITPAGVVTTIAGTAGAPGSADGIGTAARFYYPQGIAIDATGTLYVSDTANSRIRKITADGNVTTLAGSAHESAYGGISCAGLSFSVDGAGAAAEFDGPTGIAVDAAGNVYVADTGYSYTVQRPYGVCYPNSNGAIRMITPAGVVTTIAGTAGIVGNADGIGAAAQFNHPTGVATDAAGNVYVADPGNRLVRKIAPGGVVTTLAGPAGFAYPASLATDASGNVYVADRGNGTISKLTPEGLATTVVGVPGHVGFVPGPLPATIGYPNGLAIHDGSLYFTSYNGVAVAAGVP